MYKLVEAAPLDGNYFSQESIDELALRVGELSKFRHAFQEALHFLASYARVALNTLLHKK